jgi:uncharacterized protein (DUF1330 family)
MALREPLQVEALHALTADAPVTMLNLMKFRARSLDGDGTGWDAYLRYSRHTAPLLKARGATIVWSGEAKTVALGSLADGDWDYVALVWYPRPAAFLEMMQSPEYAAGNLHRENGTERHVILALHATYTKLAPPYDVRPGD